MGDSYKHFEKINDFQAKRMKTLGSRTSYYISNIRKTNECPSPSFKMMNQKSELTLPRTGKKLDMKLEILEDLEHDTSYHSAVSENLPSQSGKDHHSEKKNSPINRGLNQVVTSSTPKNGIASERCKKSKRSPTLGEGLNLTLIKCVKPREAAAGADKADKPKEKGMIAKDYEINDMYKIIQFLGKDENLQSGKLELKEKLKRFRNDFRQSEVTPDEGDDVIDHIDIKVTIGRNAFTRRRIVRCGQVRHRQANQRPVRYQVL